MISSIPDALQDPLVSHAVYSYTDILIGGRKYRDLRDKKLSFVELCEYPWVSLTQDAIARVFVDQYFASKGLRFTPSIELATTDLILPAIEHNLGIGFLPPEFVEEAIDTGTVFPIKIPDEMPYRTISMVYDPEYPHSIASTAFRKFMLDRPYNR